ncbi:MAG: 30S ribosome-binding factor RbfA [Tunicatimonas sp.]
MKESKRQKQAAGLIQRDLSELFQRNAANWLGKPTFVTVTNVTMSPDLSVAKVYLSFVLDDNRQAMMETLNQRKSDVRRVLGNRIGKAVRVVPELIFYLDESADYASHIDQLLSDLNIPPAEDDEA